MLYKLEKRFCTILKACLCNISLGCPVLSSKANVWHILTNPWYIHGMFWKAKKWVFLQVKLYTKSLTPIPTTYKKVYFKGLREYCCRQHPQNDIHGEKQRCRLTYWKEGGLESPMPPVLSAGGGGRGGGGGEGWGWTSTGGAGGSAAGVSEDTS